MTKIDTFRTMKAIASEWRRYAENLDDQTLRNEAEILEKIAEDYGEVALKKFHKDPPEHEELALEDERKGAPEVATEEQLGVKRKKFSKVS